MIKRLLITIVLFLSFLLSNSLLTSCNDPYYPVTYAVNDTIGCLPGDTAHVEFISDIMSSISANLVNRMKLEVIYKGKVIATHDSDISYYPVHGAGMKFNFPVPWNFSGMVTFKCTGYGTNGDSDIGFAYLFLTYRNHSIISGNQENYSNPPFFNGFSGKGYDLSSATLSPYLVDMCFFHDTTLKACIASPDNDSLKNVTYQGSSVLSWITRRHTTFRRLPQIKSLNDFKNLLYFENEFREVYESGTNETTLLSNLKEKQFYAFKNLDGHYGIFSVNWIIPGPLGSVYIDEYVHR